METVFDYSGYLKAGEIIKLNGRNYKVVKSTNYNAAIVRYYWFDFVFDFLGRKFGK